VGALPAAASLPLAEQLDRVGGVRPLELGGEAGQLASRRRRLLGSGGLGQGGGLVQTGGLIADGLDVSMHGTLLEWSAAIHVPILSSDHEALLMGLAVRNADSPRDD
jgi:hypothetical protein